MWRCAWCPCPTHLRRAALVSSPSTGLGVEVGGGGVDTQGPRDVDSHTWRLLERRGPHGVGAGEEEARKLDTWASHPPSWPVSLVYGSIT